MVLTSTESRTYSGSLTTLCMGILEATQVICFSVAAACLQTRAVGVKPLFGLFVLFPATFFLTNLGAGAPMIITLHATDPTPALVTAGSLVTIEFALSLILGASIFSHSMARLHFLTVIRHTNLMELHVTTISKTVIDGLVYSFSGKHQNYLFGVMLFS